MEQRTRDKMWAYVHGELTGEERAELDRDIQNRPELGAELDTVRHMDRRMQTLMRLPYLAEERLTDRIIDAFDRDQADSSRFRLIRFPAARTVLRHPAFGVALAAAACMLIVLGAHYRVRDAISWTGPEYLPMRYRGFTGAHDPAYTRQDANRCLEALKTGVGKAHREQIAGTCRLAPVRWRLAFRFQEIVEEALLIEIRAYKPQATEPARTWSGHYADVASFLGDVERLSSEITADLAVVKLEKARGG